jgi:hypothetical protein
MNNGSRCLRLSLWLTLLTFLLLPPFASSADRSDAVAGTWEGRYACGQGPSGLRLSIERGQGSQIRATFQLYPVAENPRGPQGEFEMVGRFDSLVGSLELQPTRWIKPARGVRAVALEGLLADDGGNLKVRLRAPNCGDLVLVRAAAAAPSAQAPAPTVAQPTKGPTSLKEATTPEDRCRALITWASRLTEEYPNIDWQHTPMNKLFPLAMNLYRDRSFVPVFGMRYADMTPQYRQNLWISTIAKCNNMQSIRRQWIDYSHYIVRPFTGGAGDFGPANVTQLLQQAELVETWVDRVRTALPTIPETADGFTQIQGYIDKGGKDTATLWPSESTAFMATLRARQTAVARKLVDATTAPDSGAPPTLKAMRTVMEQWRQMQAYLAVLGEEDRRKAESVMAAKLDAGLGPLVQEDVKRAHALPATVAGLTAYATQMTEFTTRYGGFGNAAPVRTAQSDLAKQRTVLLAAAKGGFAQDVKKDGGDLAGLKRLNGVLTGIFPFPADRGTPAYAEYAVLLQGARDSWLDRQIASSPKPAESQNAPRGLLARASFDRSGYKEPDIVASIYANGFGPLQPMNPNYVKFYLRKMGETTAQACPGIISGDFSSQVLRAEFGDALESRDKMAAAGLQRMGEILKDLARPHEMMANAIKIGAIEQNAQYDVTIMMQRYGCADDLRAFFNNATKYYQDPTAGVPESMLTLGDLCVRRLSAGNMTATGARSYCGCAAPRLGSALTDKERDFLRRDFSNNLNVLRELKPGVSEQLNACRI